VPLEWLVLLSLQRALLRACAPQRAAAQEAVSATPPPSEAVGRPARYVASAPVRALWVVAPWLIAGGAMACAQLYTLAILETHLEPLQLADEWLLASGWSVVQGWLIEPGIVLVRNNVAVCARNRSSKVYQMLEQLWCGVFIKMAKYASSLLD
jgi:hypothetical protein